VDILWRVLSSPDFWQKFILLLTTALLTGLLVPIIKSVVDQKKLLQQKQFEADLARQAKIIEAQGKLLEDLAQLLWEYYFLSLKVSYYRNEEKERYEQAAKEFDENSWQLFIKFQTEISKARRLASPKTYQSLRELYKWLIEQDEELAAMNLEEKSPKAWDKRHDKFFAQGARRIGDALSLLAEDLRLTSGRAGVASEAADAPRLPTAHARKALRQ
jgi:heme exporter protein D